jgi:hypothetical protein
MHLIGIDTESNVSFGSHQYTWLENDLKNIDRSVTPWVVVGGHRPMYVDSYLDEFPSSMAPVMALMVRELEPLLWKYQVNLALWAHHHSYQRHAAVYADTVVLRSEARTVRGSDGQISTVAVYDNPQATVHMVLGTGGADFNIEDAGETEELPFPGGDPSRVWYPWTEVFFYRYGITRITALNATHLDILFKDSTDGQIYDHAMIVSYFDNSTHWNLNKANGDTVGVVIAGVNAVLLCIATIYILHSRAAQSMFA